MSSGTLITTVSRPSWLSAIASARRGALNSVSGQRHGSRSYSSRASRWTTSASKGDEPSAPTTSANCSPGFATFVRASGSSTRRSPISTPRVSTTTQCGGYAALLPDCAEQDALGRARPHRGGDCPRPCRRESTQHGSDLVEECTRAGHSQGRCCRVGDVRARPVSPSGDAAIHMSTHRYTPRAIIGL